jgi:tetratricopeptide (TPR) repeat protein
MMRTIGYFGFTIILTFCSKTSFSQDTDHTAEMKMVNAYVVSGDISKALLTIEDILVKDPTYLEAQEKKIDILSQEERSKDAMKDIEEYILMYPTQPEYYYLRAVLNLQKEKYTKAIEDFDLSLQLKMPEKYLYKVYLNRGMAHFNNQDLELAELDFDEALKLDPKNAAAYHGRGMVNYAQAEYENAITEFQKAIRVEDDNPITYFNLAMTYFRLGDKENACYNFNKSCALGHRNACRLLLMECDINISNK